MAITAADIKALSRNAKPAIIDGIVQYQQVIIDGGINTPLRLCHFMAQLAHESAHFGTTREFASGQAYEGRRDLGNTHAGDGTRYRGRGLIQTTGRTNYQLARDDIRKIVPNAPDFEAEPAKLEEFPWALLSAVSYWRRRNINRLADRDDVRAVTKAVNGGYNGLDDRIQYLAKAKRIWTGAAASSTATAASTVSQADPPLRKGDHGTEVETLQHLLVDAGFNVLTDGVFGDHTKDAVKAFQGQHGLTADGVVNPAVWTLLRSRTAASSLPTGDVVAPAPLPTPGTAPTTKQDKKELGAGAVATGALATAWQWFTGSGAIRVILVAAAVFALYWFVARPILRRLDALKEFYAHADELRLGLFDRLRLALKGVKSQLWGRFLTLSGPLLGILQYADVIDFTTILPPVNGISPALYVPMVLTPLLGIVNNALRRAATTPIGQTDLALATPAVVSPPIAPEPVDDAPVDEPVRRAVKKRAKAKRKARAKA